MAEIVPVVSESLEAQVRDLLPSQRGFGEDLQASNVITPIIDLTAAAQGTTTPEILLTALAFGSQTAFSVAGSSATLANSPGFYRIVGAMTGRAISANHQVEIQLSDGLSTKVVYALFPDGSNSAVGFSVNVDLIVFLAAGESVSANSTDQSCTFVGSIRQIANVNGTLSNPSGFSPQ